MNPASVRAGLALSILGCVMGSGGIASAGSVPIEPRWEGHDRVFTIRPSRKPGVDLSRPRSSATPSVPSHIEALVMEVSRKHDMDPSLVSSVISVESGFDQRAVSPKGARGLMQLMPQTAKQYGVRDVYDARQNVEGGVAYLKDLTVRYGGDLRLALAAYNAGPEAVAKASGVPNFRETREYLRKIESRYGQKLTTRRTAEGRAAGWGYPASIVAKVDADGHVMVTNARGPTTRVIRKPRKPR